MADKYWTDERIRNLEHDLDVDAQSDEGARLLRDRLKEIPDEEWADVLETYSDWPDFVIYQHEDDPHNQMGGYVKDWRQRQED